MPLCHRVGDLRTCGALTGTVPAGGGIPVGLQSFVLVNGKPWAVNGDLDSHGGGALIASFAPTITINGLPVIVVGDGASADALCPTLGGAHCFPAAATGSSLINVL